MSAESSPVKPLKHIAMFVISNPAEPKSCKTLIIHERAGVSRGDEVHFIIEGKMYVVTPAQRPAHSLPGSVVVDGVSDQDALLCGTEYTLVDYCRRYNINISQGTPL